MEKKVYVGSYTGPEKGKGIYYCLLDTETGALRRISVFQGSYDRTDFPWIQQ